MTLLFAIPSDILRELLTEWLPIESVGCLDSACCFHKSRSTFLLQVRHVTANYNCSIKACRDFYNWVNLRKLILNELSLGDDMFDSNLKLKFSFDNSRVTSINFYCFDKKCLKGYARVINACGALNSLDCLCVDSSDILFQRITNLNNLIQLTLSDDDESQTSLKRSLIFVATKCTKLVDITVWNSVSDLRIYKFLFEKNPQLKSVHVKDDILEYLTKCKNIETIQLNDIDPLNLEHFVEVIKMAKDLKRIHITGEFDVLYDCKKPGDKRLHLAAVSDMPDELLATVVDSVPNLNSLSLFGFDKLPDSLVNNNAATLTDCNFGDIKLTVDNLNNLLERCVNLTSLTMSARSISVDILISQNMRRLERLRVQYADMKDILAIVRSFTSLHKFSFTRCTFSEDDLDVLKSQLHELDVESGRNIRCDVKIGCYYLHYQQGRFGGESIDDYLTADEIAVKVANDYDRSWQNVF